MDTDKRSDTKPVPEDLEKILNSKQLAALRVIQSLGWQLKFVRRPKFLEPEPVVYNSKFDQIGILDPDGNIDLQLELDIRSSNPEQDTPPAVVATAAQEEKRKGMPPIPGNLDILLNQIQMRALRQIESFGWQLYFVRRPLFQEPIAGIINPEGNKVATLERDGRINMLPDGAAR